MFLPPLRRGAVFLFETSCPAGPSGCSSRRWRPVAGLGIPPASSWVSYISEPLGVIPFACPVLPSQRFWAFISLKSEEFSFPLPSPLRPALHGDWGLACGMGSSDDWHVSRVISLWLLGGSVWIEIRPPSFTVWSRHQWPCRSQRDISAGTCLGLSELRCTHSQYTPWSLLRFCVCVCPCPSTRHSEILSFTYVLLS